MANWKNAERRAAELFGGKRNLRGADFSKSSADIKHKSMSIEVKYRKNLPAMMRGAIDQARSYSDTLVPVAVFYGRGDRSPIIAFDGVDLTRFANALSEMLGEKCDQCRKWHDDVFCE